MTAQEAFDIIQSIPLNIWDVMSKSEDEAIDMAFGALEKQAGIERALERLEEEKGIAFLTLANTGDSKYDLVYDNVMAYINKAIEIIKEEVE